MKKLYIVTFICALNIHVQSQNTWIQKLNFRDFSPYMHNDSLTGVKDIDIGADGDIFVIANFGQSNWQQIFKMSSTGAPIRWRTPYFGHGGLSGAYYTKVCATADSGCIAAYSYWGQAADYHIDGTIEKYSKDGNVEWTQTFGATAWTREAKDVSEIGNFYYAVIGDSVVKFDHSGNVLSFDSTLTFPIQLMPNSDLIVTSPTLGLARMDSSGNVIWSSTVSGNCGCAASYYYSYNGNTVDRIDLRDGSTVWSKSYPWTITDLDSTSDGGFVASFGHKPTDISSVCSCADAGIIFRADVNGDTLWSRTYNLSYYGLPAIKVHPSGNIITGGAFLFTNKEHVFFARDYSSFITSLDSSGHGLLETTEIIWPGDANNNQYVYFNDDALYVAIAWGDTGQPRDTIDMDYSMFTWMPGSFSDIASDWTNSFANGANHKHADFNGDGIIGIDDLIPYSMGYYFPFSIPTWRHANPQNGNASLTALYLLPENNIVPPGGLIRYFVVLGSSNSVIDSIYGISFTFSCDYTLLNDTPQVNYLVSDLGIPGTNVIGYDFQDNLTSGLNILISRTDHINAFNLNDTIAEITMVANQSITSIQTFAPLVPGMQALTAQETPLPLNISIMNVVIDPASTVSIGENSLEPVKVHPNPADQELKISHKRFINGATATASVSNILGEKIKTVALNSDNPVITTSDLPDGYYAGELFLEGKKMNFTFVVHHLN